MPYVTNNLFVYGTLLCEDIMQAVAGSVPQPSAAFAKGFARYGINDEVYPAVIPKAGGVVTGVVYEHLSEAALAAVDAYEGACYQRSSISVSLTNRSTLTAFIYVLLPAYHSRLTQRDWSYDEFCQSHKADYLRDLFA